MQNIVLWICGLSGTGKTTLANLAAERLRARGENVVVLDGDRMRAVLGWEERHLPDERRQLAQTYGRLCREIASQGPIVICATISLFHKVHEWNRANLPGYVEIYLKVPVDTLRQRDPKGLYADSEHDLDNTVVGIGLNYEEPVSPDLVIANHGDTSPDDAVGQILDHLETWTPEAEN